MSEELEIQAKKYTNKNGMPEMNPKHVYEAILNAYTKGSEDVTVDLINALVQAQNTLALCPQTTAVVMTSLLIENTLDRYKPLK